MGNRIEFEDAMKARIEKMQRPVLNSSEDLQKTQLGGIFTILSEFAQKLEDNYLEVLCGVFNQKLSEVNGALLDKSEIVECLSAMNDPENQYHEQARERWKEMIMPAMAEAHHYLEAGMNATAINYAGLVLEGKMDPIYDASLDSDEARAETVKTVTRTLDSITTELGLAGAFEETADGKLKLRPQVKTFNTMSEMEEENGRPDNETK